MAPRNYNTPRHTNDSLIARARSAKGWTQTQLADAIGTSQQQINAWETGIRKPKLPALMKIAKALEIDWMTLLDEDMP